MPPKKDTAGGESSELLAGFSDKETKLLAAAFLSSTAPDKVRDRINKTAVTVMPMKQWSLSAADSHRPVQLRRHGNSDQKHGRFAEEDV